MRVLLVEDDAALREGLAAVLQRAGHETEECADGRAALARLKSEEFDLAVLDLGLPTIDGLDVLRVLRHRRRTTPVLVVTARGGLHERISGLDAGADDYLIKPFEISEFEARVRALLRRLSGMRNEAQRIGPLQFTSGVPRLEAGGSSVVLARGELALMELLAAKPGHVVSRKIVGARFESVGLTASSAAIEVAAHRLRRKLEPFGLRVRALRGFGYMLEEPAGG